MDQTREACRFPTKELTYEPGRSRPPTYDRERANDGGVQAEPRPQIPSGTGAIHTNHGQPTPHPRTRCLPPRMGYPVGPSDGASEAGGALTVRQRPRRYERGDAHCETSTTAR